MNLKEQANELIEKYVQAQIDKYFSWILSSAKEGRTEFHFIIEAKNEYFMKRFFEALHENGFTDKEYKIDNERIYFSLNRE